jgi:hypothetical protein
MRVRWRLALAVVLACPGPLAAQGSVLFRARLVHVDGLSTSNVRVGFGSLGATVTDARGQLETAVPTGTAELEVQVLDHDWTVLYPRSGRVPVPRDPLVVAEVLVGESLEAATLRLFAEQHEKIASQLSSVGAGQQEITEVLAGFVEQVIDRFDVEEEELRRQIEREQQRLASYPKLSGTVSNYVLKARDLHAYFKLYGQEAFSDRSAFDGLRVAAEEYNLAFETLKNERMSFEYEVATYWESEELRSDLRALFDYALGEIHDVRILPLNESLAVMWDALSARRPDRARVQEAQARVERTVEELDTRLAELDRRAERVLGYLTRE